MSTKIEIKLGKNGKNEIVSWEPEKDPHLLVSGQTGGGKSVAVNLMIYQAVRVPNAKVFGIDLKYGIELSGWQNKMDKIAMNKEEAHALLKSLKEMMVAKLQELRDSGKVKSDQHIFIFVDEVAELVGLDENSKEAKTMQAEIQSTIASLLALGRAAGLHIILATQRPDAEYLGGAARDNISARLVFKVNSRIASEMSLGPGNPQAYEDIESIKGRAWFRSGEKLQKIQTIYFTEDRIGT
jgi:DNA segregation ATPase FtsK/SpoIIIE-like protein